jgi:hypothetical protein
MEFPMVEMGISETQDIRYMHESSQTFIPLFRTQAITTKQNPEKACIAKEEINANFTNNLQ